MRYISYKLQAQHGIVTNMLKKKIFGNPSPTAMHKKLKTDDSQNDFGSLLDLSVDNCRPNEVSKYFPNLLRNAALTDINIESQVLQIQRNLVKDLQDLDLIKPPIEYIYNPLEYAFQLNEMYVKKYCKTTKKLLFVGMNPGPFGMCQTGVPFGDPKWVREYLQIHGEVTKPLKECPKRPIIGISSQKKEVSGDRLWGLISKICKSPEIFFRHSFVVNYCPLAFMTSNGLNVTPSEIKNVQDRNALESVCSRWYLRLIELLQPEAIIAIGKYIEIKTKDMLKHNNIVIPVIYLTHPSPRVTNNQAWPEKAEALFNEKNLMSYFK